MHEVDPYRLIGLIVEEADGGITTVAHVPVQTAQLVTTLPAHPSPDTILKDMAYRSALGGLLMNLQSLELVLRAFHHRIYPKRDERLPWGKSFYESPVGAELLETHITSYAQLRKLLTDYNTEVVARRLGDPIDSKLIAIRDALAHGRASSSSDDPDGMQLIKFSSPKERDGKKFVIVEFNERITITWLEGTANRVSEAMGKVAAALAKAPPEQPPASDYQVRVK